MSSHILALAPALARLWPFVLKRTLERERTAGDWAFNQATAWLGRYRDDLKSARRERDELQVDVHDLTVERDQLQALVSVNAEVASIGSWRKSAATIAALEQELATLRADLKAAADTIVRLKGGACDHVWEAVHAHPLTAISGSTLASEMIARCSKCGLQPASTVVA